MTLSQWLRPILLSKVTQLILNNDYCYKLFCLPVWHFVDKVRH
ncbi:hypothetical protein EMIT0P218_10338 [Pseudomonas sp. IT-P218]